MFEIPDKYKYTHMIHAIAERYGQSLRVAEQYTELDFWEMQALASIERANMKAKEKNNA